MRNSVPRKKSFVPTSFCRRATLTISLCPACALNTLQTHKRPSLALLHPSARLVLARTHLKQFSVNISVFPCQNGQKREIYSDAAFLHTVGSFLLTVELFYLQLIICFIFLLAIGAFFSLTALAFLLTGGAFLPTLGKCV